VLFLILVYLTGKPSRYSTFLIPGGVSHTFDLFPKPEIPGFTPDRVIQGSLGGDQSPLLTPKGRSIIRTQVLTSLTSGAPLPSLVPAPHWVLLCMGGLYLESPGG
jgi:hypothetical protein